MSNFISEYRNFIENLKNGLDKDFKISFHSYPDDSMAYTIESDDGIIFNYDVDKNNKFKSANLLRKDSINRTILNENETSDVLSNINNLMENSIILKI